MTLSNEEKELIELVKSSAERWRWICFVVYILGVISGLILALFLQ